MCLNDALVIHRHGQNGNGLGWRTHEVEINPTMFELLWGKSFTRDRMLVVTQFQEGIPGDHATRSQAQLFGSHPQPVTTFRLTLGVVIILRQMLVEVGFCPGPILLWYATEHN